MWWGRHYWGGGRRPSAAAGVVVMFAWLSSQERHVRAYVELYAARGWACLVCHSDFLTLYGHLPDLFLPSFACRGERGWSDSMQQCEKNMRVLVFSDVWAFLDLRMSADLEEEALVSCALQFSCSGIWGHATDSVHDICV